MKVNNLVAKHAHKANKSAVHRDRKRHAMEFYPVCRLAASPLDGLQSSAVLPPSDDLLPTLARYVPECWDCTRHRHPRLRHHSHRLLLVAVRNSIRRPGILIGWRRVAWIGESWLLGSSTMLVVVVDMAVAVVVVLLKLLIFVAEEVKLLHSAVVKLLPPECY